MTQELQQKIIKYLQDLKPLQPFTIEDLVRNLGKSHGEDWKGVFEIAIQDEIEKYLVEKGLIKEYGTTKLYITS
jgi:hypothetical protein